MFLFSHPCFRNTLSSAAQTHQHSHAHILLVVVLHNLSSSAQLQSMLIMHNQVCIETHRHAHARPHTHTHRGTHTHTQAYASRLFSIQQAFAHCSPRVTRSTSSIPDRLNMERMADEQSRNAYTHITLRST